MNEKITTLIPTYRRPKYLRRAILSVLRQTYGNLQVNVFDNASLDETSAVVSSLSEDDARLKYFCHERNIGALANFRYAFQSINTPYFSILSDDDCITQDFYENAINVLNSYPDVMFVILNSLVIDENINLILDTPSTNKLTLYCDKNRFDAFHSGVIPIYWIGMVFRKEVAEIYAKIEDENDVASDMRFLLHAVARYNFAHLSTTGAFFTAHSNSISSGRNNMDLVHHAMQIYRYVEIFNDKKVDEYIRHRARFYINDLLKNSHKIYSYALNETLKLIIKNSCRVENYNNIIQFKINCFKQESYYKTGVFLKYINESEMLQFFFRLLFSKYYKYILNKHRFSMRLSQFRNANLFNELKKISTTLEMTGKK